MRAAAALATLLLLTGCTPDPQPSPTPTPLFASEDEAFAAAEATYRGYTDALNQVDFADPKTFEAVYAHLAGNAATSTRKSFSEFHAEHIRSVGSTTFDSFTPISSDPQRGEVRAHVCVDVSKVEVLDASGSSLVSKDRPARQPMDLSFGVRPDRRTIAITAMQASEDFTCAP